MSGRARRVVVRAVALAVVGAAPALADVQEQRARLPPPADCGDDVEGVWMSHTFYPHVSQWYIFTLTVRRAGAQRTALEGSVHSMYWSGDATHPQPPVCAGSDRSSVEQPARGTIVERRIAFGGTGWRSAPDSCRVVGSGYNPDQFSGVIDPTIEEFQTKVEDGGIFRGEPTVFRRVRCLDPSSRPEVRVEPPPFYPGRRGGGCGC